MFVDAGGHVERFYGRRMPYDKPLDAGVVGVAYSPSEMSMRLPSGLNPTATESARAPARFQGPCRALLALGVAAIFTGCTAIKATVHVAQADQALAEARNHDAQNLAVYEYTMALRYIEKAREELGSSDHRMTENLAKRSAEWADKAIISIERGRRGIDTLEDGFDELPTGPVLTDEDLLTDDALEDLDAPEPGATFENLDDDFEIEE